MELNAGQIKKALECHSDDQNCVDCPYTDMSECSTEMAKNALDLIKNLTEENERLRAELSVKKKLLNNAAELVENIKSDTVRKMQERLKARNKVYCTNESDLKEMNFVVDQIAKEMLEGVE